MSIETRRLEVSGAAPFKQSGVYEVQISISARLPQAEEIASKRFTTLWQDRFHLHVKDSKFTQILGSDSNPIPNSVLELPSIWIIVSDQFSSLHSVFEVKTSSSEKTIEPEITKQKRKTEVEPIIEERPVRGERGVRGPTGLQGERGPVGPMGPLGERGPVGERGPQGVQGDKGPMGIMGQPDRKSTRLNSSH